MKILLTGSTGYIGSHLLAALKCAWRKVHVVRLVRRPIPVDADETLVVADLTKPLPRLPAVDIIVNAAGFLALPDSTYEDLYPINSLAPVRLATRFAGRTRKPFLVHLSTNGVSGPLPSGVIADETYPCRPVTPYERTKREAERLMAKQLPRMGVDYAILRPTFVYGPADPHKLALFRSVKRGLFAFIGDPETLVHPVYIDDLVEGIVAAVKVRRKLAGRTLLLAGPRPVTKGELVTKIADHLGVRARFLTVPEWLAKISAPVNEKILPRIGLPPMVTRSRINFFTGNWAYSTAEAARLFGYAPTVDIDEGIARTIRDYRSRGWL